VLFHAERNHTGVIKFLFAATAAAVVIIFPVMIHTRKSGGRHIRAAGKAARNQQVVACWNTSRFNKWLFFITEAIIAPR